MTCPARCGGPLGGYRFTVQKDGNMAEYFHVNDADYNLAPIPEGLADEVAVYAKLGMTDGVRGGLSVEESLDVAWWSTDGLPEGTRVELTDLVGAARRALHL